MIHVKKKSKAKLLIILTAVMAVLIAGYFILVSLSPEGTETPEAPTYDQLAWEGTSQRVFPDVDTKAVQYITVNNPKGSENETFGLVKTEDGTFSIWYLPKGSEEPLFYMPDIVSADPSFTYSSLYAMDSFGQGQVARFFYLRSAITTMYFTERISLKGLSENEVRAYLEEFGFMDYGDYDDPDDNKDLSVIVNYGKNDSTTGEEVDYRAIRVGGRNPSENGYYVMIDDPNHPEAQNYIYATNNSNIGYATQPYTYYINPAVISAGLEMDGVYEPYMIKDYHQWRNELVSEKDTAIDADAEVIVKAEISLPKDHITGGLLESTESTSFHLGELSKKAAYERLVRLLLKQKLTGIVVDGAGEEQMPSLTDHLYVTLLNEGLSLSFPEGKTSMTYTYKIKKITAALTADGEERSGSVPADATALIVEYDLYIDGSEKAVNTSSLHAALSLTDDRIAAYESTLRAATINENVNISLNITHDIATISDIHKKKIDVYVADIIAIYDADGRSMTTITEDSVVSYRYYLEINGVKQETYLSAADKIANMDEANKALFLALGKVGNGYNQKIGSYVDYLDIMQDYISYTITAIPYMIVREEIVHFAFQKYAERDPFYGESIYVNLTEGKHGGYGLNNPACENVLLHLGGAGTSSTASNGYAGDETVAIGLTPENMRRYGLYAHTIYYELPRVRSSSGETSEDENAPTEFNWQTSLGFTVYISDKRLEDGRYVRYIASDLYDVIVRVEDEKLDFVEFGFVDFWARNQLFITDIEELSEVQVEFNFEKMQGRFDFILDPEEVLNDLTGKYEKLIRMIVRPGADAYENRLVQFMIENGRVPDGELLQSLVSFYNHCGPEDLLRGNVSVVDNEYAGTHFFKQAMLIVSSTLYLETFTAEEQADILANAPMLARIRFVMNESEYDAHVASATYEFYRASDRRVLVKIQTVDGLGNASEAVSDFAIATPTFKKIMGAFDAILNARKVTGDEAFFDPANGN